jgi:hypothetical protein
MADQIKTRSALEKAYDLLEEAIDMLIVAGEDDIRRKVSKCSCEIEDAIYKVDRPKAHTLDFDMAKYAEKLVMWR